MSRITLPDCGSNSCFYTSGGGMRTNGPCSCQDCPTCGTNIVHHKHRGWCTTSDWKTPLLAVCEKVGCSLSGEQLYYTALRKRAVRELVLLWADDPDGEGPEVIKALETCLAEMSKTYPTPCAKP
jgi:hypothetical protein